MPFVRIQLKEGRTPEQKKIIAESIIDTFEKNGVAPKESVRVIFEDMAPENFYTGEQE